MDTIGLVLRVVHIALGVFWAGAAVMLASFILPAVRSLGPDGGRFVERMMGPGRFGLYMTLAGTVTALTGVVLLFTESGGNLRTWLLSEYGLSILVGSVAGLLAFVYGIAVNAPTARRLASLAGSLRASGGPPAPGSAEEMQRLQRRLTKAGNIVAVLLAIAVLGMAAAHAL